jgi:DNA-binding LacI/PurR family transcriptional regulator
MKKREKYTMKDVARLAGVSTSTVSAVVNENLPVSEDRKQRVLRAMAALHYQPDEIARSLKKGRTRAIGFVVPDITNAFYPEVVRGVEEAALEHGYAVFLCDSQEDAARENDHLLALFSRRVDGVLLACCGDSTSYETTLRLHVPCVFVDRLPTSRPEGTVSTDNVQAGYLAARHLLDLGHRRIAMIVGRLNLSPHRDRLEGFRKAMQEANLPIRDEYLILGDVQIESGFDATRQLLELETKPSAVMVSNNKLLLGLLQALDEKKIKVPEQMSVVGFDDYAWNKYLSPAVTAIAQPTFEMGRQAFGLLLQLMNRDDASDFPSKHLRLLAELRVRKSTAALPAAS